MVAKRVLRRNEEAKRNDMRSTVFYLLAASRDGHLDCRT